MLKQGFISILFFNVFNVAFSAGIDFKYSQATASTRALNILVIILSFAALAISIVVMELAKSEGYGEFKAKFKETYVCRIYVALSIVYRFGLGLYTSPCITTTPRPLFSSSPFLSSF